MTPKTKNNIFFGFIIVFVIVSIYLTYERAFIVKDFEIIQSENVREVVSETTDFAQ